jgi:DNA polymerase
MLRDAGIPEEVCYFTNLLRCRPLENKLPSNFLASPCLLFLRREVTLLKPMYIVSLGGPATEYFLDKRISRLSLLVGSRFPLSEHTTLIPLFHPSAALRGGGRSSQYYKRNVDLLIPLAGEGGLHATS